VKGVLSPYFSAWLPVVIGIGGGLFLLRQASR
jgi:lipopolysaccharide export system permease protein